ncbi:MAG: type II secretion system protein [Lentisphaeria bacterium]|nr:type II secretion system protein [Lentisphaeria bacterium]
MRISTTGNRRRFTLVEILVVLAIFSLVLVLVLPRTAKAPAGVAVRVARQAMEEPLRMAAMRARATGRTVTVTLNREESMFIISAGDKSENGARTAYPVPDDVDLLNSEETPLIHTFFSHGGAAGPELSYVCRDRRFILSVDKLNSRVMVTETNDGM